MVGGLCGCMRGQMWQFQRMLTIRLIFVGVALFAVVFLFLVANDWKGTSSDYKSGIFMEDKPAKKNREKTRGSRLERVEASLSMARGLIKGASLNSNCTLKGNYPPQGDIYRNPCAFERSYQLMEKLFKVFVYEEGEPPIFHMGPCKSIYSMEGVFFSLMETSSQFRTLDPDEALVYFLPFSVVMMVSHVFHQAFRPKPLLKRPVVDYVRTISHNHPFWNRSHGADHFMLSCHDWGPRTSWYVPELFHNSIRALCNANTSERFKPKKDVSIPEIHLLTGEFTGLTGGLPPSGRTVLAFFAGGLHGKIRLALLRHWKGKDNDVQVYEKVPAGVSYPDMMKKSKYCICPSGFEVASPRIVEAIYAECVPVILSQHYILPFSDVLNWDSFSVQVSVEDLPNLKKILMEIPGDRYLRMQEQVKRVQKHFVIHDPPKRFDVFHMIIHSIWLRRLNSWGKSDSKAFSWRMNLTSHYHPFFLARTVGLWSLTYCMPDALSTDQPLH